MDVAPAAAAAFRATFGTDPAGLWAAPGRVNLIGEHTDYNAGFVLPFALPQQVVAAIAPTSESAAVAPTSKSAAVAPTSESAAIAPTSESAAVGPTSESAAIAPTSGPAPIAPTSGPAAAGPGWTVCSDFAPEPVNFTDPAPGTVTGWAAYIAGVVWALRDAGHAVPPARIALASDVPVGAGVSSSAALESAVLTALVELGGLNLPLADRPAIAQRAENAYVGAPTGIMDQSASLRCEAGRALFLDCRSLAVEQIPFDLAAAGLTILVIDTNTPHRHVDGEYGARRASCEDAARILSVPALRDVTDLPAALSQLDDEVMRRRVRHVVTENQRVLDTVALLRAGRIREIGPLLTASHASMRDDFEITVDRVDVAVGAALAAGAYGARMTGGGFGGCVLALIDADRAAAVTAAVEDAYRTHSYGSPTIWPVTPGPGARRLSSGIPSRRAGYAPGMTVESDENRPNEFGFAGAATAPEPTRATTRPDEVDGESIAVPSGDLTGAISEAIEDATSRDDDR